MEILCWSFSRVTTLRKRWFSLKFPNSLFFLIFTGHVDYEVEHIYKPKKLKKTPHFSIYLLYGGLTWLQKFRCLQVGQGCSYLPSFAGTPPDLNGYILYVISGIWLRCFLVQPVFVATAFSLSLPAGRAISASNYISSPLTTTNSFHFGHLPGQAWFLPHFRSPAFQSLCQSADRNKQLLCFLQKKKKREKILVYITLTIFLQEKQLLAAFGVAINNITSSPSQGKTGLHRLPAAVVTSRDSSCRKPYIFWLHSKPGNDIPGKNAVGSRMNAIVHFPLP